MTKRKTKQDEINFWKGFAEDLHKSNKKLVEAAENSFLNSPTYIQMLRKIRFLEASESVSQNAFEAKLKSSAKYDLSVTKLMEDNQNMLANHSDEKYFIGITESRPDKLKDKAKDERLAEYAALVDAKELEIKLLKEQMEQMSKEHADEIFALRRNSADELLTANPRGAGRKEKMSATVNRLSDVEEMLKDMSAAEVAKQLGICRATLFKRLKSARDEHVKTGEDPFIL